MDILTSEAIQALTTTFRALLPAALRPSLLIIPRRVSPTGLGGFVGPHADPDGAILGCRVAATAAVTVRASTSDQLATAVNDAVAAVLGVARATLLQQGLLRLSLDTIGPESASSAGDPRQRELSFSLLYEFLKTPTEAEGIIQQIPITIAIAGAASPPAPPEPQPEPAAPRARKRRGGSAD